MSGTEKFLEMRIGEVPFVAFDTETSLFSRPGESAFYDIVEIGCIAFRLSGQIDSFHSLVKPHYPFNRVSCRAMHITEARLESAPNFTEIANSIENILSGKVIVGQNTQFDIRAVRQATDLYGNKGKIGSDIQASLISKLNSMALDTKDIFSGLFPKEKQKSLDVIAQKIGVNSQRTKHSALEDAVLTLNIFKKLVEMAQEKNVSTLANLFELQGGNWGKAKQVSFF